jgi:pseudouridine synthase
MTPEALPRLNRFLARAGLGSRRAVEALVESGRVRVNGVVAVELGVRIDPDSDRVEVDGRPVHWPAACILLAYHKPHGMISSLKRQDERPCLADARRSAGLDEAVVPVGRLDAGTSGLLIWTNDGELAQRLMRPDSGVWKRYEVTLARPLDRRGERAVAAGGLPLDGRPCLPARILTRDPDRLRWRLEIHEGRNRQVRRIFELLENRVTRLHRTGFGPIRLEGLVSGKFRELTAEEVTALRWAADGERKTGG